MPIADVRTGCRGVGYGCLVELHSDGSVTLTAAEAADLKELFEYLLTGRRLAAGWSADSQARYVRFTELRRKLLGNDRS